MGGDDFQKGGSDLGLRDAIGEARQRNEDSATARAGKLFDEMGIIEEVIAAINQGTNVVDISFPKEIQAIQPDSKYSGENSWSDVIEKFSSLVMAEDVQIEVHITRHACCKRPSHVGYSPATGGPSCSNCPNEYHFDHSFVSENLELGYDLATYSHITLGF
jgi:DnaJ-class molecular chaperone